MPTYNPNSKLAKTTELHEENCRSLLKEIKGGLISRERGRETKFLVVPYVNDKKVGKVTSCHISCVDIRHC